MLGEVTVSVAEPLPPGARVRLEVFQFPSQAMGRLPFKPKDVLAHPELSLSVTLTPKVTGVPAATGWLWEGDMVIVGLARVQLPPATTYTAEAVEE